MKHTILPLALASLFISCGDSANNEENNEHSDATVVKQIEIQTLDFSSFDTTANPRNDFYQFACGGWLANNPIPEEESKWSNFNVLDNNNNDILKNLLEDAQAAPGTKGEARQLIGDLYNSCTVTVKRNELGYTPVEDTIAEINAISSKEDLQA